MNVGRVTKAGLEDTRPGREALPGGTKALHAGAGVRGGGRRRRRTQEELVTGEAEFRSYYGRPVIKKPVWEAREIAGYFFLGGLAGASSLLALGADLAGRPSLARGAKVGAACAISLSLVALVKDLGRPSRFLNMLRVFKPTSPMSVGTWIVAGYAPAAIGAAACELSGAAPLAGGAATAIAAALGPAVAAYTGVLVGNTAVPAWHGARQELPFVFVASAASAAGGLGLCVSAADDVAPAQRLALLGGACEVALERLMEHRLPDVVAKAYHEGRPRALLRASRSLAVFGACAAVFARRNRAVRAASGLALLASSACTRFGIFYAGIASAEDPAATIVPQRERLAARASTTASDFSHNGRNPSPNGASSAP